MKVLIITLFTSLLITVSSFAQGHLIVRVMESQFKNYSKIIIVDEAGESEIIPLKDYKTNGMNDILISNQNTIRTTLDSLVEKGYTLIDMTSSGGPNLHTIMIYRKED